jgi:bifunctional UDP-N-acetylglucosamine pyrophosphorylase / glucosamine-1-phosphate N-acetyltransferase
MHRLSQTVISLLEKGVRILDPSSVHISEDISPDRISGDDVIFYPGTRLSGSRTLIDSGVRLGYEAPATLVNCRLGPGVELKGGFFSESAFLERSSMGSGAHVREGCLLEEQASGNHAVGLKQTLLFPFVTLGSLINFCDCLMAGGTSRKNHSEVGSSYIHFNYTPHQDKATPSLVGDVPRGVMLSSAPIFLGGQGGLVGPARIGYGTIIAAGAVYRRDCLEGDRLLTGTSEVSAEEHSGEFVPERYGFIARKVFNNVVYIANLLALKAWYLSVRQPFFRKSALGAALFEGVLEVLQSAIQERLNRFRQFAEKMESSLLLLPAVKDRGKREKMAAQQRELSVKWPEVEACFSCGQEDLSGGEIREAFLVRIDATTAQANTDYLSLISALEPQTAALGTAWLQDIVDTLTRQALTHLPTCRQESIKNEQGAP